MKEQGVLDKVVTIKSITQKSSPYQSIYRICDSFLPRPHVMSRSQTSKSGTLAVVVIIIVKA